MGDVTDNTYPLVTAGDIDSDDHYLVVVDGALSRIVPGEMAETSALTARYPELIERGHPIESGGTRVGVPGVVWSLASTTFTVTANTIYYAPFLVYDTMTFDSLKCEVTSIGGTIARVGVFRADTAWQPTQVLKDGGTVDTTGAVVRTASFAAVTLAPGRYLTGLVCDGGAAFRAARGDVPLGEIAAALGSNTYIIRRSKAAVGTGALAVNAWDTATASNNNGQQHMVFLQLSGV